MSFVMEEIKIPKYSEQILIGQMIYKIVTGYRN